MSEDKTIMYAPDQRYAPHQRDFYELEPKNIRSYSETDSTMLPDPVTDPIVAMNISNVEFDYTYFGGEELYDVDLYNIKD